MSFWTRIKFWNRAATDDPAADRPAAERRPVDRRALVRGGTAGAAILLVGALVLMVNYLGWKYHHRFDWTAEQLYSLSEKTENVLANLEEDVQVIVFLQPVDEMYEPARELLSRYEDASPRISVRYLDPERNLLEARQFAEQYELSSAAVVFDDGEDFQVVASADLAEYDFSGMQFGQQPEVAGFKGEQRFTRALLDLADDRRPKVLFTVGHGEIRLDDRGPEGLGEAQALLREDNFELEEWASLGADAVPPDADLVVIAGPTSTFLPPELELFTDYLESGGRMLVLLDPVLDGNAFVSTGLEEWLRGYGVDAGADVVVDPSNPLPFFGAETLFANRFPDDHPVTRSVRQAELPVLVSLARSVARGDVPDDLEASLLLTTSDEGWGETDLADPARDDADLAGPVPLAVAVQTPGDGDEAGGGLEEVDLLADGEGADGAESDGADGSDDGLRLVVFGDSSFATGQLLNANVGNAALLGDALNWLVEREALLGIPAKRPEQVRLSLSTDQVRWLYIFALALLPGLGMALGVVVYYRRRR